MEVKNNQLYLGGCDVGSLAEAFDTPLYVYEESVLREQCRYFKDCFSAAPGELHYAMKANSNPAILRLIREEGMFLDTVSPFEVQLALECDFKPHQLLFTGSNCTPAELQWVLSQEVAINVGSLDEIKTIGQLKPDSSLGLRINADLGKGHHPHVMTGGPHSKLGIYHDQLHQALDILRQYNLKVSGIHCHIGTDLLNPEDIIQNMELTLGYALEFPELDFVDFGGGFGIPYRPDDNMLPLKELGQQMCARFNKFLNQYRRPVHMKLEPGRFLTAQAGVLLVSITTISSTPEHLFVGVNSGFGHLMRPVLYGSYHEIVNASRMQGEAIPVAVAGNLCEAGDIFTQNEQGIEHHSLTKPQVGDILAILDCGAYGLSLSSNYNMRALPAEILVAKGNSTLIRRRQTYQDLTGTFL